MILNKIKMVEDASKEDIVPNKNTATSEAPIVKETILCRLYVFRCEICKKKNLKIKIIQKIMTKGIKY